MCSQWCARRGTTLFGRNCVSGACSRTLTAPGLPWLSCWVAACRVTACHCCFWMPCRYVKAIGRGFGKRAGQFDMPTWLCMVPDGAWGSHLCVVDSCNYRLQVRGTLSAGRTTLLPDAAPHHNIPPDLGHRPRRSSRRARGASSRWLAALVRASASFPRRRPSRATSGRMVSIGSMQRAWLASQTGG